MSCFSICIINVYFGKVPNYFELWLQSAAYNPSVNFLLVTDQEFSKLPSNVYTLKMDLAGFSVRATETIGIPISLSHSYKCCDFKVAYGLMFEKELKGYDFWGHCDLDLVWGDLRKFITDAILEKYDKIYPMGHLALYRNNDQMRKAFMLPGSRKGGYTEVFTHAKGYAFDELGGIYEILNQNGIQQYEQYDFADISPVYSQMKIVRRYIDYSNNFKHQIFLWSNGCVFRYYLDEKKQLQKDEFAYLHLQKRKFKDEQIIVKPGCSFMVLPKGFYAMEPSTVEVGDVRRNNRYKGKLVEQIERKMWNMKLRKGKK